MYTMIVTAENSVGTGPYTEVVSIQTEEAGNTFLPLSATATLNNSNNQ